MKEPVWLTTEAVLAIQEDLLARFGGMSGVRDQGLLESALHRPQQIFHYGEPTLHEMAAAYAAGIIKNHPFLDGKKRAGFMAAYVFLGANGYEVETTEEDVVIQTLALAAGAIKEAAYARWLRRVSVSERAAARRSKAR